MMLEYILSIIEVQNVFESSNKFNCYCQTIHYSENDIKFKIKKNGEYLPRHFFK